MNKSVLAVVSLEKFSPCLKGAVGNQDKSLKHF